MRRACLVAALCLAQPGGPYSAQLGAAAPSGAELSRAVAPTSRVEPCPAATTRVTTAAALVRALDRAVPGEVITLADGTYSGRFAATRSGTPSAPVTLCGGPKAILDGGSTKKGYVLHLDGADYWHVRGLTVRNGQKGVMLDDADHVVLSDLTVRDIGHEGVHLRRHSSNNLVTRLTIRRTGVRKASYGEGLYVGSARSNWASLTGSSTTPDRSDANRLLDNDIADTTAEAIDVKEGTTGGSVDGNLLDGAGTTAADSVVDIKGSRWTVRENTAVAVPEDAFQTHRILAGWGDLNVFTDNIVTSARAAGGEIVALHPVLKNVADCTNRGPASMTSPRCR